MLVALVLAAAVSPPVIHESFAPLPCPKHQVSTLDIEGCLERQILKSDKQIDTRVASIFALLRPDARAGFAQSERAWLASRRASCEAESSKYAGGTFAGVAAASCTVARNKTHLQDLEALKKTLPSP